MYKPELLSPAGTLEKLKTAFLFGADAVYAGVPDFSLRARINSFDHDAIKEGTEYAHKLGKKLYATANIFPFDEDLKKVRETIEKYCEANVDAIIISDPGIVKIAKEVNPDMPLHLSTQSNCTNSETAKFWYDQGVSRIIIAREMSLENILSMHEKVPEVELECFVHGAMCVSYSGRCILSKLFSDRSANQGKCSQPCRWGYDIMPTGESDKNVKIEQDQHGTYILNSKDLCLINHLDQLRDAGVISFKIEGRTKSTYYVTGITKLYRQAIDGDCKLADKFELELEKFMNRGYTSGFLFSEEQCEHNFQESHKECNWQFVGEVVELGEGEISVKIHNELFIGDEVEIVIPHGDNIKLKIDNMKDVKSGDNIEEAHGGQEKIIKISIGYDIGQSAVIGSVIRKKRV
ncbi:U32 family peptidase [bacterium]|nr:MAG: U32 family peptidase [bacterium]